MIIADSPDWADDTDAVVACSPPVGLIARQGGVNLVCDGSQMSFSPKDFFHLCRAVASLKNALKRTTSDHWRCYRDPS